MNFTDVALNTVFPDSPAESTLTRSGLASLGLHSGHSFGYGRSLQAGAIRARLFAIIRFPCEKCGLG
jgi:hypothetical protein